MCGVGEWKGFRRLHNHHTGLVVMYLGTCKISSFQALLFYSNGICSVLCRYKASRPFLPRTGPECLFSPLTRRSCTYTCDQYFTNAADLHSQPQWNVNAERLTESYIEKSRRTLRRASGSREGHGRIVNPRGSNQHTQLQSMCIQLST